MTIPHNGGDRPILANETILVTYREGSTEQGLAGDWDEDDRHWSGWDHNGHPFDIVAYEIIVDRADEQAKVHLERMEG